MIPFRNLLSLSVGDFVAKTLYFLAFVYLARVLGVANYGTLEFALSILTYFLVLADGGLELWATREAARGKDVPQLVAQIIPLRLLLTVGTFGLLIALLPVFPDYPGLQTILILFGLTLFTQAVSLKWVFMGREQMKRVALGLVVAQIVFAVAVFGLVDSPAGVIWVPIMRLAGDLAMGFYFWRLFLTSYQGVRLEFTLRNSQSIIKPALTMGASHGLAFMSYNFDSVLLGFLAGATAVGWYSAAYKPITALLAIPVTYFIGLFPTLSRTYSESPVMFRGIVVRSLRLTSIFAVPIGIGGAFLAEPIINLLFGPAYTNSIPALQILSWSAMLVLLRGTYRQAFNAAGKQRLDLRCAATSVTLNVILNLFLIPYYGIIGAALATLVSEILWLSMSSYYFSVHVVRFNLLPLLLQPTVAALIMGASLLLTQSLFWIIQAVIGGLVYLAVLLLLGHKEVWSWVQLGKAPVS